MLAMTNEKKRINNKNKGKIINQCRANPGSMEIPSNHKDTTLDSRLLWETNYFPTAKIVLMGVTIAFRNQTETLNS